MDEVDFSKTVYTKEELSKHISEGKLPEMVAVFTDNTFRDGMIDVYKRTDDGLYAVETYERIQWVYVLRCRAVRTRELIHKYAKEWAGIEVPKDMIFYASELLQEDVEESAFLKGLSGLVELHKKQEG